MYVRNGSSTPLYMGSDCSSDTAVPWLRFVFFSFLFILVEVRAPRTNGKLVLAKPFIACVPRFVYMRGPTVGVGSVRHSYAGHGGHRAASVSIDTVFGDVIKTP